MAHQFQTQEIQRVDTITPQAFVENYVKPQIPLVIQNLTQDWRALQLWNFEYFKAKLNDYRILR